MSDGKLYVMQDGSGLVKVGMSRSPEGRLKTLLTGNPSIKLLFSTDSMKNCSDVEKSCHDALCDYFVVSEWFNCTPAKAIGIVESIATKLGVIIDGVDCCRGDEEVIKRINSAAIAGIKIKSIASRSNVTYFRMSSVINPDSYRGGTRFTDDEVERINAALDAIKKSF